MNRLPTYLTQDELTRFFAAIRSPRDRAEDERAASRAT